MFLWNLRDSLFERYLYLLPRTIQVTSCQLCGISNKDRLVIDSKLLFSYQTLRLHNLYNYLTSCSEMFSLRQRNTNSLVFSDTLFHACTVL